MTFSPSSNECNLPCSACYAHHCNRHLDQALFCVTRSRLREWHNPITEVLYHILRAHGFTVYKDSGHDLTSQTKTDGIVEFGPTHVFIDTCEYGCAYRYYTHNCSVWSALAHPYATCKFYILAYPRTRTLARIHFKWAPEISGAYV